jgi:D-beta-D-heptose 7-phosphate kinase/D-beta-D-heptose 1-phosphate adenosyltransferase
MSLLNKVKSLNSIPNKPSILVVGDLMIDRYIMGSATRLSPEAPVPVVNVKNETATLGGAGNVVQNLVTLGAKVSIAGMIGDDAAGQQVIEILQNDGVETETLVKDSTRPTTVKTRVLVGSHQLVRIDRETTNPISVELENQLVEKFESVIENKDIIIFSDYNKGLFAPSLTQRLIKIANQHQKKVIVDPKGLNYEKYSGAFIIKPNRKELAEAAKVEGIKTNEDIQKAAEIILKQTNATYLIVTLSEDGMAIISKDSTQLLSVKATEVFDVTGAGDTVIATIAYFLAAGFSIEEACELANHAAAIVIRHIGSATTTIDEILADMVSG